MIENGMLSRRRPETCLSDRMLDRLRLGEIAGPERSTVEAHLRSCALCRGRQAELSDEEVPIAPVLDLRTRATAAGEGSRLRTRRSPWRPVGAIGALAAGVLIVARAVSPSGSGSVIVSAEPASAVGEKVQVKGGPFSLDAVVRRRGGARVEPVLADDTLREGDALRFRVRAPQVGYLAVLDLDARGRVSVFGPAGGPLRIGPGEQAIDGSVVLDDAVGDERIIAVLCPTNADAVRAVDAARAALRGAGGDPSRIENLALPCLQSLLRFRKSSSP